MEGAKDTLPPCTYIPCMLSIPLIAEVNTVTDVHTLS